MIALYSKPLQVKPFPFGFLSSWVGKWLKMDKTIKESYMWRKGTLEGRNDGAVLGKQIWVQPALGVHDDLQKLQVTAGMQTGEKSMLWIIKNQRASINTNSLGPQHCWDTQRATRGFSKTVLKGGTRMRPKKSHCSLGWARNSLAGSKSSWLLQQAENFLQPLCFITYFVCGTKNNWKTVLGNEK